MPRVTCSISWPRFLLMAGAESPLVRVKYESVEVLPYYYLFRERAVLMARRVAERTRPSIQRPRRLPATRDLRATSVRKS